MFSVSDMHISQWMLPVALCVGLWCFYFVIEKFCYGSDRAPQDIEQGLPRSPSMQEPADDQHKAFKEVSWAAYKEKTNEEITKYRTECAICIQEFKDEEECRFRSKCSHIYHKTCIDQWLAVASHRQCPNCRGSVRGDVPRTDDDDQSEG